MSLVGLDGLVWGVALGELVDVSLWVVGADMVRWAKLEVVEMQMIL